MRNDQPIPPELNDAIRVLFKDAAVARDFLQLPSEESTGLPPASYEERVAQLEQTLVKYILQMAAELEELGEDERPRLESEARATLVAIREVRRWLK